MDGTMSRSRPRVDYYHRMSCLMVNVVNVVNMVSMVNMVNMV